MSAPATTTSLDFSRCRLTPFKHQFEDVQWLLNRPFALIASEMRTGKSKIVIDAIQFLYEMGRIKRAVIFAPAPVRDVWFDPAFGELAKHLWNDLSVSVTEYHSRIRTWTHGPLSNQPFAIYVTNYEFLRSEERLEELSQVCDRETIIIGDESSYIKNWSSLQTKSFVALRRQCGYAWLLNGTPIYHSPKDLFAQGNALSPTILQCPFMTQFKARYALQTPVLTFKGEPLKKVVGKGKFTKEIIIQEISGWTNLEDLERRFKPYTVRRLQKDCPDMPVKLDPVTLTAELTPTTWRHYRSMRDDLVAWLNETTVVSSATAAVKVLKLSQLTGGFLSGAETFVMAEEDQELIDDIVLGGEHGLGPDTRGTVSTEIGEGTVNRDEQNLTGDSLFAEESRSGDADGEGTDKTFPTGQIIEVGREKLDVLLWFLGELLAQDPNLHVVVWVRFRAELFRILREVQEKYPQFVTGAIAGGQKRDERLRSLALLHPDSSPMDVPVLVCGIEGTGSFGLNMTAAHTCITMSSGYSVGRVAQTLDRVYGPGQKHPIAYYNIVAVGPKGQRTIDHDILSARLAGEDIATRTASAWVTHLTAE